LVGREGATVLKHEMIDNCKYGQELFGIELDINYHCRSFPDGEADIFSSLQTMPSRHKTYWDTNYKIKVYSKAYGNEIFEYMSAMKRYGVRYLNQYWIDSRQTNDNYYFLFGMVPGIDMLFKLINNFSVKYAIESISTAFDNIEQNVLMPYGDGYLMSHDYKLFNVINYNGVICFDYDRFSIINNKKQLYAEFWKKVITDDLTAIDLQINNDERVEIIEYFKDIIYE
jgi:hypothetical protein